MPLHAPLRSSGRHRARHAAPGPASTPLTGLVEAVAARTGGVARRGAVVVASTGLVMTMGVTASSARPLVEEPRPQPALTAPAERLEASEPAVTEALTVAADVPVTFARSAAPGVIAPPPPPPPPPAPVVEDEPADEGSTSSDDDEPSRAQEPVSRSGERVAVDEAEETGGSEETGSDDSGSDERGSEESGSEESGSDDSASVEVASDEVAPEEVAAEEVAPQESAPEEAPSASSAGSSVLDIAAQYVGTPYSYGGTSPSGFDCSGFTQYVFAQAGISLPRTAAAQGAAGTRVSRSEARPGDLAVVSNGSHVGIYAGGNQWYDSPRPGKSVSLRDMWTSDVYFVRY